MYAEYSRVMAKIMDNTFFLTIKPTGAYENV
jgi:hypothetical protein